MRELSILQAQKRGTMYNLDQVLGGKNPGPYRIIIYGTDGIGKSTWASNAPDPVFIDTEGRLGHIECKRLPQAETLDQVYEQFEFWFDNISEGQTVVIDSLDWLEGLVHKAVTQEFGGKYKSIAEIPYANGFKIALDYHRQLISGLDEFTREKKVNIILTAHAQVKRFEDPMRESYDQYRLSMHEKAAQLWTQWADCVFFANLKTFIKKEEAGFNKEVHKAIGEGSRVLYTEERPSFDAKNSYSLPFELPLQWEAFEENYLKWLNDGKEVKKTKKKKETKNG